jgi:SAM-dependent methyltransferase
VSAPDEGKRPSAATNDREPAWPTYVQHFHRERPGITEAVLARATDAREGNPYSWTAAPVQLVARVLDVGCGSGPAQPLVAGWIGLDSAIAELAEARLARRGPVVAGRAEALPLADGSIVSALAVMSLMVVDDPSAALRELHRVVLPAGKISLLLPADEPLTVADRIRYLLLLATLGRAAVPFPHPAVVRDPISMLGALGFDVIDDASRRFQLTFAALDDADLFVDSLYLPGVGLGRQRAARALVRTWRQVGLPLRRVIAVKR